MSETLEQIDKRISEELFGTDYNGMTLKYARRLVAALGAQGPVALDHIACIEDGKLRYMSGRKAPAYDCELYATSNGKSAPKLYAAPVVNPDWQMVPKEMPDSINGALGKKYGYPPYGWKSTYKRILSEIAAAPEYKP